MFEQYYGFKKKPFSLTPDPDFYFLSTDHVEAIEHLIYGISNGEGFLMLVGGIGTGKTTTSRVITQKLNDSIVYSLILNPFQDFASLLKSIITDFGMVPETGDNASIKRILTDQLINFLLHDVGPKGKTALVIIDEAQNLSVETLEQLRLISNIETNTEKLIQILLLGQEELIQKLEQKELRQLNQRISVKYFLSPLSKTDTARYIEHRIKIAEPEKEISFNRGAMREIFKYSGGVPRVINMIAGRCLVAGFVSGSNVIDKSMVLRAKESLHGEKFNQIMKLKQKFSRKQKDNNSDPLLPFKNEE